MVLISGSGQFPGPDHEGSFSSYIGISSTAEQIKTLDELGSRPSAEPGEVIMRFKRTFALLLSGSILLFTAPAVFAAQTDQADQQATPVSAAASKQTSEQLQQLVARLRFILTPWSGRSLPAQPIRLKLWKQIVGWSSIRSFRHNNWLMRSTSNPGIPA